MVAFTLEGLDCTYVQIKSIRHTQKNITFDELLSSLIEEDLILQNTLPETLIAFVTAKSNRNNIPNPLEDEMIAIEHVTIIMDALDVVAMMTTMMINGSMIVRIISIMMTRETTMTVVTMMIVRYFTITDL